MYSKPEPVPDLPNPRLHPEFYTHKYTQEYQLQGFEPTRPQWAQFLLNRIETFVESVGIDLLAINRLFSPYFTSKQQYADDVARFTFNPIGDDHFLKLKEGGRRIVFGGGEEEEEEGGDEGNSTISALLPAGSGFDYKNDKVRGVNLGNWLLFELWMDSTLSAALNNHAINAPHANPIVDEWTAGQYSEYSWASYVLKKHYETWITEQDFIDIKAAGLNHLRIPFPYWAFAEAKGATAPYLTLNQFDKLIQACGWAKTHGLKVWVDIHSVPGSQNGYDNSGHAGAIDWASNPEYYTQTQYTFNRLATLFSQPEWKGTVTAIEAVNEPAASTVPAVATLINEYYPWARNAVARPPNSTALTSLLLAMHDGFLGPLHWEGFFTGTPSNRVLLDTHPYFVYSAQEKVIGDAARLKEVCALESTMTQSNANYPTIAGEWSVNGPNGDLASDRDLSDAPFTFPDGPAYPYSKKYMAFMAQNYAVQTATFEKGAGWIFWAWKNSNDLDWSYQAGLEYGWITNITSTAAPWSRFGTDPCADYR
ncbi:hypothetical protein CBS101457_005592 [Exobasidium rhododendri]|nr:hypothetical protein CBS101457_005592 [Exobasidium rhododendri]